MTDHDCNLDLELEDLYHSSPQVDPDDFKYSEL
jgi:hypothetical protein